MMIYEATLVIADYDIGYKLTRSGNRFNRRIFHEMGYRFIFNGSSVSLWPPDFNADFHDLWWKMTTNLHN